MTIAPILTSLIAGGLLGMFFQYFALIAATTAVLLMAGAGGYLLGAPVSLTVSSALLVVTSLQMGFFLGTIIRSLRTPGESPTGGAPAAPWEELFAQGRAHSPRNRKKASPSQLRRWRRKRWAGRARLRPR